MINIYTGPIGSGKTTQLERWMLERKDVCGILMPVIKGVRHIYSISSGKYFRVEAGADDPEEEVIRIRKFRFSKKVFKLANFEIEESLKSDCKIIVVDEIGPLELNGSGFYSSFRKIVDSGNRDILAVVREGLVEDVVSFFNIKSFEIITDLNELNS